VHGDEPRVLEPEVEHPDVVGILGVAFLANVAFVEGRRLGQRQGERNRHDAQRRGTPAAPGDSYQFHASFPPPGSVRDCRAYLSVRAYRVYRHTLEVAL